MDQTIPDLPGDYLINLFEKALTIRKNWLLDNRLSSKDYAEANPYLEAAPDGSYVCCQMKRDRSSHQTNFAVSPNDPHTYALLATLQDPVKIGRAHV